MQWFLRHQLRSSHEKETPKYIFSYYAKETEAFPITIAATFFSILNSLFNIFLKLCIGAGSVIFSIISDNLFFTASYSNRNV